jgi:exosome complex component RRP4
MRKIVVPGELVSSERKTIGSNVYVTEGKIFSKVLGIAEDSESHASVVPLKGIYTPQKEDTIIGIVNRVVFAGYGININGFTDSFIPAKGVREPLQKGDVISAKIADVNEMREAELMFPRRLVGGQVIEVIPVRTPRLIGKNDSMLNLLKDGTGCQIVLGKNGRVWAKGGETALLENVVRFIESNSYRGNLTNAIEAFFTKNRPQAQKKARAERMERENLGRVDNSPRVENLERHETFDRNESFGNSQRSERNENFERRESFGRAESFGRNENFSRNESFGRAPRNESFPRNENFSRNENYGGTPRNNGFQRNENFSRNESFGRPQFPQNSQPKTFRNESYSAPVVNERENYNAHRADDFGTRDFGTKSFGKENRGTRKVASNKNYEGDDE